MSEQHAEFIIPTHDLETKGYLEVQSRELHSDELSSLSSLEVARQRWGEAELIHGSKEISSEERVGIYGAHIEQLRNEELAAVIDLGIPDSKGIALPAVLKKAFTLFVGTDASSLKMPKTHRVSKARNERQLIQLESEIGSHLFGAIPAGNRREFFCLDKTTWIWHDEVIDIETGKPKITTTRYEVHDNGILKAQEGAQYNFIEGEELTNLLTAARMYYEQAAREIYKRDPQTGQKLA